MILVTGSLLAQPGQVERLLELSLAHVERSRAEPGCLLHSVYRDVEESNRLVFLEKWRDAEALRAHFALESSREFVARASKWVAEPPTLEIFAAQRLDPPGLA